MNKHLTVAFSITILLTVTVLASVDFLETANAVKSKGTSLPETGSKKVCGDKLCSEVESKSAKDKHGESSHGDKDKMKERHLQMLEKMKSMSKMEMIDSMKAMMQEHHDMKIEKMSQMDGPELMKNIEHMLEKMSKDEHSDMGHEEHHLKTFDELDFDVFTNQKWDRLHESHAEDIIVHWPDGRITVGIEPHIEDLKKVFTWAPDTRIQEHPIKIASGQWTSVTGITEGTFTEPMVMADGTVIEPTGKSFKRMMNTIGYWEDGVMVEEWLFWDNLDLMKQIGIYP